MKNTKTKLLLLLAIAVILGTSCIKDLEGWCGASGENSEYRWPAFLYPPHSLLKKIHQVNSNYELRQTIAEYEYDDSNRIRRIVYPVGKGDYDEYNYRENGQLANISKYRSDDLIEIISFVYDKSGNKIKEQTDNIEFEKESYVLFIYQNERLVKTEHYQNDKIQYYVLYEYNDSGQLQIEKLSVPSEDGYVATQHTYAEGLLIYSVSWSGNNREDGFMFDMKRYYDLNGNMTLTISNMPGLSSAMPPDGKQAPFLERRVYEY